MQTMGRLTLLFYGLLVSSYMAESSTIWEHGEDLEGSRIISESTGQMSVTQKTRQQPFNVPKCMQIVYIRVYIDNEESIPAIHFNEHINMVTIHYKPNDKSVCYYKVTVKAITDKSCASEDGSEEEGIRHRDSSQKHTTKKHKKKEKKIEGKNPGDNSKKHTTKKHKKGEHKIERKKSDGHSKKHKKEKKSPKQPVKLKPSI